MATRRRAQDLTPAELEARRARDRAAQQRKRDRVRGTESRDTAVDNADDARYERGTTYRENDAERTATYRENVPRTYRDGRGTTTDRESSYREADDVPRSTANDVPRSDVPRRTANDSDARDDDDDGHGAVWPNGQRPLAPGVVNELARVNERRAAHRDWAAIDACGLCDRNGFVIVDTGASNGGVPTVAFCSHMTTLPAPTRLDLD